MPSEVWIGFLGLIVGGLMGFFGDLIINNRKMKFDSFKDIKVILNNMHIRLVEKHSKIQQFYTDNRDGDPRKNIISLKPLHWEVMEIYKEYRIYFGEMKAYELQSAVYNYCYESAKSNSVDVFTYEDFFIGYQALKDAYGLMINEVKLGLVSVHFIKGVDKKIENQKIQEYKKYSDRLMKSLKSSIETKVNEDLEKNANTPKEEAAKVVNNRISPFEREYNQMFKVDD